MPNAIPESSLNRLAISAMCPLEEYRGQRGTDLLHSQAILRLKEEMGSFWTVEMAQRVAALLFSLLGDRPQWPGQDEFSPDIQHQLKTIADYWLEAPKVLLGGGFLAGPQGPKVMEKTRSFLRCWDIAEERVELAEAPENMPLAGAAKAQGLEALILDFGHSSVKARWGQTALSIFPMTIDSLHEGTDLTFSQSVLEKMRSALSHYHRELENKTVDSIVVSLAAYVQNGGFMPNDRGGYCKLQAINPSAQELITDLWKDITGETLPVTVFHDGMAAARLAPPRGAAVIFGTAIGHGFSDI